VVHQVHRAGCEIPEVNVVEDNRTQHDFAAWMVLQRQDRRLPSKISMGLSSLAAIAELLAISLRYVVGSVILFGFCGFKVDDVDGNRVGLKCTINGISETSFIR